ncbi:hypothetical protein RUM43_007428 [Polyplax serrata]|uniref:Uncharacterized protein n=1 Tax=Polyplax serrata TaxID=468196 RepID=A0AAN8PM87_POLSC
MTDHSASSFTSLHKRSKSLKGDKINRKTKRSLSAELQDVFTIDEIKEEVRFWKILQNYVKGRSGLTTGNNTFKSICGLCLAEPKEQKWLIKFRKAGLRRLNHFLQHTTRKEAQSKNIKLLTWSCLSLLSFYYSKNQNQVEDCNCVLLHKFDQSKALFRGTMYLILPEKQTEVIRQTIRYITITEQWNTEDYDSFVFQELLTMITKAELLIAKIIKQIERSQRDAAFKEAYTISCSLSTILEQVYWDKYLFNHLLHNCFNTLLKLYLLFNVSVPSPDNVEISKLRGVIKTCTRNFISNIKDNKGLVSVMDSIAKCLGDPTIGNEDRFEISELITFCAQRHICRYFRESITPDLLELLLNDLLSRDKSAVMLSHKIFHHLLDRHGNIKYFTEPVYFFKGRSDFTINHEFGIEDVHFFKSFCIEFFDGIHQCFLKYSDKYELVTSYITLCLVLVEIPDPVITINVIHTIITTQNDVLKSDMTMTMKAHIHATIAAVMSLICIIHNEEVTALEKYVEEVLHFRAENSPHLLPPLQAGSHILRFENYKS